MSNDEIQVVTYHSVNAKPQEQWLGYVVLPDGNRWLVSFSGTDEASVIAKAKAVYLADKAKQARIYGVDNGDIEEEDKPEKHTEGRGHHFAGKVWVVNRTIHDLRRIDPSELEGYLAKGYVKGGPRSTK